MESSAEKYAAFKQKVSRTVYLDNMSPQVTESVIRTALDQFATVKNVKFIPNYIGPSNQPQCALVELDSAKKAKEILSMIAGYPFMMSGQPRPVRARPAVMEMFDDQPIKPNRKIKIRWLEPSDPDFELAKEVKNLTRKHAAEVEFLDKVSSFLEINLFSIGVLFLLLFQFSNFLSMLLGVDVNNIYFPMNFYLQHSCKFLVSFYMHACVKRSNIALK
ncbi:hypothetical protein D0Y65_029323 [Glycine soja]|uniref:RRM domain-containing protein n=1 Tax=Glycine soja TaxID=3848 RepID=A0A445HZH6_GLYSO|nr:hypothetical protein D0Y65_029323 [Glycine soja]RZB78895.1 hypothetical protein D0Y65_029323 [Glycine soja]